MPDVWTLEIACALCGAKVTIEVRPGQHSQRYCSKTCKRRAGRRRYKARRRQLDQLVERMTGPGPLCPRPYKRTYRTWAEAQAAIDNFQPPDPQLTAYHCECGAIHLGH